MTVCVFEVWVNFPFMMLMSSAALTAVDHTVYEAAWIDGASSWRQFWHITLPLIARSTYIAWILMTIFVVNDFPSVFLLTGGGPSSSTTTLVVLAYQTVFHNFQHRPGRGHRIPRNSRPHRHRRRPLPAIQKGSRRMTSVHHQRRTAAPRTEPTSQRRSSVLNLRSLRYLVLTVITVVLLAPIGVVILLSLRPTIGSGFTFTNFSYVFGNTGVLGWLLNSLQVSLGTVLVSVLIGAPAGYVLARGKGRVVGGTRCCCSWCRLFRSSPRSSRCSFSSRKSTS